MQTVDFPLHNLPAVQFLASDHSTAFGEHAPSHRISFFALIWFMEDADVHFIDFEPHPIKKDTVYLIGKNQVHAIPSPSLPRAKTIVFSSSFFSHIEEPYLRQLFSPFQNNGITIAPDMVVPLTQLFTLIVLENNTVADRGMLLKYTTALLMHLYRFSKQPFSYTAGEDLRMIRLFQLLEENYKEQKSAMFYASHIGLTAKRINEILRQKAGTTINGLLNQLVLIEAKRELFHLRVPVKEIAYNLGFSDQSYFARFFKKHAGITPEQFKAKESADVIL